MTTEQAERLRKDLVKVAGDPIEITAIGGTIYITGSELATLRLFAHYQTRGSVHNPRARCGYSENLKRHYFSLEMLPYTGV